MDGRTQSFLTFERAVGFAGVLCIRAGRKAQGTDCNGSKSGPYADALRTGSLARDGVFVPQG